MAEHRVLVIDSSVIFSKLVEGIVNSIDGFVLCGTATNLIVAKEKIEKFRPQLIILDIELNGKNILGFVRQLIPQYTVPIIAYSSKDNVSDELFDVGVAAFVPKPDDCRYDVFKEDIKRSIKSVMALKRIKCQGIYYPMTFVKSVSVSSPTKLIAIGGSTGSTDALPIILKGLGTNFPPVVVTLHMPAGYTALYAKRLMEETHLNVIEAQNGLYLENNMVVIAQGNHHMRVMKDTKGFFICSQCGPKVSGHCPSVDVLFESIALVAGENAIGVILTGMGSDGARGMKRLKLSGGYTIGQSKKTCVVYGMPQVAYKCGAVDVLVDIQNIALEIMKKLKE